MTPEQLWVFLPFGYLLTVAIETPVLLVGMSAHVSWRARLLYGLWLTACTYPIVILVLPIWMSDLPRWQYLLVAETFAPLAECALFWGAQRTRQPFIRATWRDFAAIVVANLASFGAGVLLYTVGFRWW